ncbi:MAG: hypothetical protein PHD82_08755, partial [Candidatus Riflebacteria bacterium]|nr:hypothetical protein [Candidatus Riflebacteria bacterium]
MKKYRDLSDNLFMKNTGMASLMALIAISILLLLPGYKKPDDHLYFPAPVAQPAMALYLNFSASGLYDQSHAAAEAFNEITSHIENICAARNISDVTPLPDRATIEALINERILSGELKVHEVFFYFRDQENFAMILRGEFSVERIS